MEKCLELPRLLSRDGFWLRGVTPQLEFVVDNETLAGLANLELKSDCVLYDHLVQHIQEGLGDLLTHYFVPKASFLNPVEWRPREFNTPPDTVCNWVLSRKADLLDLRRNDVTDKAMAGWSLQVHCDGGYRGGAGAAAFVVHSYSPAGGGVERVGYYGAYLPSARSAFQAEIFALDNAVAWIRSCMLRSRSLT